MQYQFSIGFTFRKIVKKYLDKIRGKKKYFSKIWYFNRFLRDKQLGVYKVPESFI